MNRRTVAAAVTALALAACVKVSDTSTGIEHLPPEFSVETTIYTQGSARLPLPCFASLTIDAAGGETIINYVEITEPASYTVPISVDGQLVTEFNTQGCQPWTLEP